MSGEEDKRATNDAAGDYLWDGSGEPDAAVRALERVLAPAGYAGGAGRIGASPRPVPAGRGWRVGALAAAAAVVLSAGLWWMTGSHSAASSWEVAGLAGMPTLSEANVDTPRRAPVGAWLETDAGSRAILRAEKVGNVKVGPGSRIRIVESGEAEQRLELARGSIDAFVIAPPKLFFVDTPAALAVDMGCAYTLDVDEKGTGLLRVTAGWVELNPPRGGRGRARVPAGSVCAIIAGRGPGVPYFEDAPAEVAAAAKAADAGGVSPAVLDAALSAARPRDSLTLWHLLERETGVAQGMVYDRLALLVAAPDDAGRKETLMGDPRAMEAWWGAVRVSW